MIYPLVSFNLCKILLLISYPILMLLFEICLHAHYDMVCAQESQIGRIFGTMLEQKLQDFDEDVKPIGTVMTAATIELYNVIVQKFLPTPAKIHYLFNLRDISRVLLIRLMGIFDKLTLQ